MNYSRLKIFVVTLGLSIQTAHAVNLLSPSLVSPQNTDAAGIKQPLKFSWTTKNAAIIKQYHLIISTNERFSDYDVGKAKCVKASNCVDFITKSTSYTMAATHPFLQKENTFFWQVQAFSKTGDKSLIFQGQANVSTGTKNVRDQVNVNKFFVKQKNVDIDDYSVTPPEGANGSTFDFSVMLTDELPIGQSVKIQYNDESTWHEMKGSGVEYHYSHAFTIPSSINDKPINYVVGVFSDSGEIIRRRDDTLIILATDESTPVVQPPVVVKPTPVVVVTPVVKPVIVPSISTINVSPSSVIQGNSLTFSSTLSDNLPNGYSVKVNYGNGFETMNGSSKNFDLTAIPNASAAYKIGIYDSKNVLKSNQLTGNFSVSKPAPVVVTPVVVTPAPVVTKTTGYTKISNSGAALSDSAKLGSGSNEWACTKDNKTGLIWEVKTDDGGLRDKDWYYSWYEPDTSGYTDATYVTPNCSTKDNCNTYAFTNAVNTQGLCGAKDWRLPSIDELKGLLTTTNTINQPLNDKLYIDATYFPNSNYWFWSSSPDADDSGSAWFVHFYYGYSYSDYKGNYNYVRLVRG